MICIAHRGASGYAPENTMAAFKKAVAMGADMIEFDVQLTRDQKVVVIHDYTLDRTTDGDGLVNDHTLEEIQAFDAGSWFGVEYSGERVPTLDMVLEWLPSHVKANIELKSLAFRRAELVKPVVDVVRAHGKMSSVVFSSFDHTYIQELNQMGVTACGLLIGSKLLKPWTYLKDNGLDCVSINPSLDNVDLDMVKGCHDAGLKVYVYTVNDRRIVNAFEALGVDGVFSDYPDLMIGDE